MRKIICLQVLAVSVYLPIVAEIISQEEVIPSVTSPSIVTPVELPVEPLVTPQVVTPVPAIPTVIPSGTPGTVPAAISQPIQTVPALPVPAISSEPSNLPYVPFSNSIIPVAPGSSTFYNPYGPGPGLPPSPLESRLNAPLGQPFSPGAAPAAKKVSPISVPGYIPGRRNEPLSPIPYLVKVPPSGHFGQPTFLSPGLVRFSNDRWVGSDYLYNISPNIGVAVELVLPPELSGLIHKERVREEIEVIFSSYKITPFSEAVGDLPPLPFFHLIAFVAPVRDSYVLTIAGRLFEEVKFTRLDYQLPGTGQAITWEKQELIVSSRSQVIERLREGSRDIAILFAGRVKYFNRQQLEQKDELTVQGAPVGTVVSPFLHEHSPCCTQ